VDACEPPGLKYLAESPDQKLKEELLSLLAGQANFSPIAVLASMGLVVYFVAPVLPTALWLSWFSAVIVMQVVRWNVFRRLDREHHVDINVRLNTAANINFVNSILHGLPVLCFPLLEIYQCAIQSMLLVGMGAASVFTTAGYPPFRRAHILFGLIPMYIMWAWVGVLAEDGKVEFLLVALGVGYILTLHTIARRIFSMVRHNFETRLQLGEALALAESADQAKTRFLAAASHDLRQPMHTLSLFSAALGMRNLDQRSQHIARGINDAVEALASQLDSLLDISKLDAGIVTITPTDIDLDALLNRLQVEFAPLAVEEGITLSLQTQAPANTRTDAELLERILRNLLSNAIRHNQHCTINLGASRVGQQWRVTVSDTGTGIPEGEMSHIFEEFYQVHNPERDRSKGLGLGLSIVKRLVDLLEIQLDFNSSLGEGTEFSVLLPATSPNPPHEIDQYIAGPQLPTLDILVVDNESSVREGMQTLLECLGCTVEAVDGADAALDKIAHWKPQLALVDFRLPGAENGLHLAKKLRNISPDLAVIIISGDTAPELLQQASAEGITLLTKPVLLKPLSDAIRANCHIADF
jgi:signal transduction histidine kinase